MITKKRVYLGLLLLLSVGAIVVNIKNVFTNYNIDAEYAIAMSYRMVKGDAMFSQMWEPHQTSGFLAAFFISLYLALAGTTTGIAVYLNMVGLALKGLVTLALYGALRKKIDGKILWIMCLFFFTVNPKNMLLPEFSNMQVWFGVLLFCALFQFWENQKKLGWLVLAGVFLCLEVLSYPACFLGYVAVVILLALYSQQKKRDIFLFTGTCTLIGILYMGYFGLKIGPAKFLEYVRNIVAGDASHSLSFLEKWGGFAGELFWIVLGTGVAFLLAFGCTYLWNIIRGREKDARETALSCLGLIFVFFCVYHLYSTVTVGNRYLYLSIYLPILFLGWVGTHYIDGLGKRIYLTGMLLSLAGLFATLLLTNLTLLTSMAYLILGVTVSLLPLSALLQRGNNGKYLILFLFCGVTIFRNGFLVRAMQEENMSVLDLMEERERVQQGPAKGITSDWLGARIRNSMTAEWDSYVFPGDCMLIVGGDKVSTIGYLYEEVEIGVASTICTPTFDEKLLEYWTENPQKYPSIIVVSSLNGVLDVPEDSWIMQWIEREYKPSEVEKGEHWTYYRK